MRHGVLAPSLGALFLLGGTSFTAVADDKGAAAVPKEVHALVGTYTGSWTMA